MTEELYSRAKYYDLIYQNNDGYGTDSGKDHGTVFVAEVE